MSPRTTVALSVCPDGKLADDSKGGTASDSGGRALPLRLRLAFRLAALVAPASSAAGRTLFDVGGNHGQRHAAAGLIDFQLPDLDDVADGHDSVRVTDEAVCKLADVD